MNEQFTIRESPTDAANRRGTSRWIGIGRKLLPSPGNGIRLLVLLLVCALIVIVARDWDWWGGSALQQTTDDAYLQADLTPLAAKSAGYVRSVPVQDFQKVKAGDLLVEIVDDDYRATLDKAEANVNAAAAAIANIEQQKLLQQAMVKQAEATIQATQATSCPPRSSRRSARPWR
jgi:membrane fusion protein, multidrug efflux system